MKCRVAFALVIGLSSSCAAALAAPTLVSAHRIGTNAAMTMVIGDVESYTGDVGALGAPADKAIKLAVQQLNSAAKADGIKMKFKLVTADDQSSAQTAVTAAEKLVGEGASCLTGPEITPNAIAILDSVTLAKDIPMFPEATSVALRAVADNHTIWRTAPPDSLQAGALVAAVKANLHGAKGKTVAIGYQNIPYGAGIAAAFKAGWTKLGGVITADVGYNPGQPSYDSVATAIVQGNPDAYVFSDYPQTFATVADALLRTGSFHADRLFVSDALAVSPIPSGMPPAALNGAEATYAGTPDGTPQAKAFNKLYARSSGPKTGSLNGNEFDSGVLCGLAAIAAASTVPSKINAEIRQISGPKGAQFSYLKLAAAMKAVRNGERIHYEGVSGPIDFNSVGDTTSALYDISTWRTNRLVLIRQIEARPTK